MTPKDIQVLIPRTYEYSYMTKQTLLEGVIILRWGDNPVLFGCGLNVKRRLIVKVR